MASKRTNQTLVIFSLLFLSLAQAAQAGFGISPPYVQNSNLSRNSYYEQKIWLGRADPEEELRVNIEVNVPGANDWISIDRGKSFILPKGEKQIPIIVGVRVPNDAAIGDYKGNIKVRVYPTGPASQGQVSIVLGAQIDVDLTVLDKVIFDFKVWKTSIPDLEEGHRLWWLYFPGRLVFETEIENLGNIKAGPTKILLNVYDAKGKELLETLETTNIDKIEPFATQKISVEFPTKLSAGSYESEFKVFKGQEVMKEGRLHVSILPYDTLSDYKGYGFAGLSLFHKITVVFLGLGVLIVIGFLGYKIYKFYRKKKEK